MTLAFAPDGKIIGFGILEYPPPGERWQRVGDRIMMEVSVIEVGRPWRSLSISKKILRLLIDHPIKEERIFYMVGGVLMDMGSGGHISYGLSQHADKDIFSAGI